MTDDPHNLQRFLKKQKLDYGRALFELKRGQKEGHWMWWIFPQIEGLGWSPTTQQYSIDSIDEAKAYLQHEVLGDRLHQCAQALLNSGADSIKDVVYWPDDLKIQSSVTLFEWIGNSLDMNTDIFAKVLDTYFDGERDDKTITWLENGGQHPEE